MTDTFVCSLTPERSFRYFKFKLSEDDAKFLKECQLSQGAFETCVAEVIDRIILELRLLHLEDVDEKKI
ncbi:MAG TPA: hypothetical protein O0X39_04180 [Methanocorpusculum sp.]|nr:hypothetical protein [Methanocorpusculum sp.]